MNRELSPFPHLIVDPVEIGEYSYISEWSHISQLTKIGRYCSIGNLCTIGAQQHPLDRLTTYPIGDNAPQPTVIGNDVWIGSSVVVMAGLTVGDGAVLGAGSVVTKDVQPYAIVAGNPARVLRYRFSPADIADLLCSKWWDLPIEEVAKLPFNDVPACLAQLRGRL